MALSADDDVAQATAKKWVGAVALAAAVPGGLQRGTLSSWQPGQSPAVEPAEPELPQRRVLPYGTFAVTEARESIQDTSSVYLDYRLLVIEIRGLRTHVETIMPLMRAAFNRQQLETTSPFLACLQMKEEMAEDPNRLHAEPIWIGRATFEVWTDRDQ